MRQLNDFDLQKIRRMLPSEVREALKTRKCFLAGGCIRAVIAGEVVNDIDLFVASKADADEIAGQITQSPKELDRFDSENAITLRGVDLQYPIQIIHRWTFNSPSECLVSFDFTIACAAFWYGPHEAQVGEWTSLCDDAFYEDLAAKRLVYRNPDRNEDAGGSMFRLLKFYRAGYTGPLKTVADVMARLSAGINPDRFRDQSFVADIYLGLLREVDPFKVDSTEDA